MNNPGEARILVCLSLNPPRMHWSKITCSMVAAKAFKAWLQALNMSARSAHSQERSGFSTAKLHPAKKNSGICLACGLTGICPPSQAQQQQGTPIIVPENCELHVGDKTLRKRFNVGRCKAKIRPGKRCVIGWRLCWKKDCHKAHPGSECPL